MPQKQKLPLEEKVQSDQQRFGCRSGKLYIFHALLTECGSKRSVSYYFVSYLFMCG